MAHVAVGRAWPRYGIHLLLLALLALVASAPARSQTGGGALIVEVSGAIGVAASRQISRAIELAQADHATALIIRLGTPGGLVSSTRDIIKQLVGSPVPIVVYVAPSGARAASAGTFLVYASHIAAMAPGTNVGAATPVEIGGVPGVPPPRPGEPSKDEKSSPGSQQQTAAQRKAMNDVIALLRSLAQLRGRNAEWAEKAVRDAATLTATEAHKEGVIDVVTNNVDDLLAQIDGRTVSIAGAEHVLVTKGVKATVIEPDMRTRALSVISDPNIAFILLMVGFYGLILEFWNPGSLVPGVVGSISLILALTALSALPVNYGALGLIVLGLALMIGEAFTPGIGALGIGGLAAFLVGSYYLFEAAGADIEIAVSLPLIIGMALTTAGLMFGIVAAAMQARRRVPVTGAEQMIGSRGRVVDWQAGSGHIRVHGEIWAARSARPLQAGDAVRIVERDGLTLIVES